MEKIRKNFVNKSNGNEKKQTITSNILKKANFNEKNSK